MCSSGVTGGTACSTYCPILAANTACYAGGKLNYVHFDWEDVYCHHGSNVQEQVQHRQIKCLSCTSCLCSTAKLVSTSRKLCLWQQMHDSTLTNYMLYILMLHCSYIHQQLCVGHSLLTSWVYSISMAVAVRQESHCSMISLSTQTYLGTAFPMSVSQPSCSAQMSAILSCLLTPQILPNGGMTLLDDRGQAGMCISKWFASCRQVYQRGDRCHPGLQCSRYS